MRAKLFALLLLSFSLVSCASTDAEEESTPQVMDVTLPAFLKMDEYNFLRVKNSYTFVYKNYAREDAAGLEASTLSKMANTDFFGMTVSEIVQALGKPSKVLIIKQNTAEHLNLYFGNIDFYIGPQGVTLLEIRLENPEIKYSFLDQLTIGSSIDDIVRVLGDPVKRVNGQKNAWNDMVLYTDIDGQAGRGYISCHKKGIRLFIWDGKVAAIYLYEPNKPVP
jgi:hypothetical protein